MTVRARVNAAALTITLVLTAAASGLAQDKPQVPKEQQAMMDAMAKAATPGPNHKLLEQAVGNWSVAMRMWMDPSAPPTEVKGTAEFRSVLGGRYVTSLFKAPVMGMDFEGWGLSGYDNVTGKFVGIWFDNMSTGVMFMTGSYDPATHTFTYTGEMADPMQPSTMVKYREVLRIEGSDRQVMEMYEGRGGKEAKTMEAVYTRVK